MRIGIRMGKAVLLRVGALAIIAPNVDVAFGQGGADAIDYRVTDIQIVPLGIVPQADVEAVRGVVGHEFPAITVTVGDPLEIPPTAFEVGRTTGLETPGGRSSGSQNVSSHSELQDLT